MKRVLCLIPIILGTPTPSWAYIGASTRGAGGVKTGVRYLLETATRDRERN
jgi:hypothetical protein